MDQSVNHHRAGAHFSDMVYNGGVEGGSGKGFGGYPGSMFGVPGQRSHARSGQSQHVYAGGGNSAAAAAAAATAAAAEDPFRRTPSTVGCKRRLNSFLELDGLADQFEQSARVRTPPIALDQLEREQTAIENARDGGPKKGRY